jgi:hypothetical protein
MNRTVKEELQGTPSCVSRDCLMLACRPAHVSAVTSQQKVKLCFGAGGDVTRVFAQRARSVCLSVCVHTALGLLPCAPSQRQQNGL